MKDRINELKSAAESRIKAENSRYSAISMMRLISFMAAVVLFFLGFSKANVIFLIIGAFSFALFVVFVKQHSNISKRIKHDEMLISVLERYIDRIDGKWMKNSDKGMDFLTPEDTLSHDIDLIGKGSLFQYISIAHSTEGRRKLADIITLKKNVFADRKARYDAISELADNDEFRYEFETLASKSEESFKDVVETDEKLPGSLYVLMVVVPLLTLLSLVYIFCAGGNPAVILITFIVGLAFTWIPKGILDKYIVPVSTYGNVAEDYYEVLDEMNKVEFKSSILKGLKERVTGDKGILEAIKSMQRIGDLANISFNPIIHMLLAGFVGWDLYMALIAQRWMAKHKGVFGECRDIIADIEELGSFAVLVALRDTCEPEITEEMKVEFEDIYHPLIPADKVISNSASLGNRITIITGSNMSGKTTFLRSIAINTVLCYVGCGVCASSFRIPVMKLFTSMRVMDDISGGISTFFAEILRIKSMADYVESGADIPALCLIDEIFKGTNSADRIVGAEEAVKKLSAGNCLVMLSTHDFELCDITSATGEKADNYHFEEHYKDDTVCFDYKIKNGRCTTRNALALLKMAGIVKK